MLTKSDVSYVALMRVGVILNEHVFEGVKKSLREKVMWIKVYFLGVKKKPIDDHVYFVGGVAKRLIEKVKVKLLMFTLLGC